MGPTKRRSLYQRWRIRQPNRGGSSPTRNAPYGRSPLVGIAKIFFLNYPFEFGWKLSIWNYRYQFPPMNPLWHGILGFVIGVLGVISVIGNGMVIYIFSTTKSLRTPSNLLVVNLAFSDFFMMFTMSPTMVINCYQETWVLGQSKYDHLIKN